VALAATASFSSAADEKQGRGQKARSKGKAKQRDGGDAKSRDDKFRAWDKDGDGSISHGEYPGHPGNFRALDTNNDGVLSVDEFRHRAGGGAPAGSGAPDPAGSRDEDFRRLDADGDGGITRKEWPGRPSGFDAMDANGDGVLSRDEHRRGSRRGGRE
jgi:Ca2+-binding EF-hand superfamily protein